MIARGIGAESNRCVVVPGSTGTQLLASPLILLWFKACTRAGSVSRAGTALVKHSHLVCREQRKSVSMQTCSLRDASHPDRNGMWCLNSMTYQQKSAAVKFREEDLAAGAGGRWRAARERRELRPGAWPAVAGLRRARPPKFMSQRWPVPVRACACRVWTSGSQAQT